MMTQTRKADERYVVVNRYLVRPMPVAVFDKSHDAHAWIEAMDKAYGGYKYYTIEIVPYKPTPPEPRRAS